MRSKYLWKFNFTFRREKKMTNTQSSHSPIQFRSRDWVLNQATEEELREHLQQLLVAQRAQHEELMAVVEVSSPV